MLKKSLILIIVFLSIPTIHAITCDFSGWNVPTLSPDNTIILDGDLWQAYDNNLGTVYTREILKQDSENNPIIIDPTLTEQDYLNIANDFLERNDVNLNIHSYSAFEFVYDDNLPIVKFLGENQICYDYYVVGSFAGAVKFTQNEVYSIFSKWYKPIEISNDPPTITPSTAAATVGAGGSGGGGGSGAQGNRTTLAILPLANDTFRLVWDVKFDNNSHAYVDAHTGDILTKDSRVSDARVMMSPPKSSLNIKIIIAGILSLIIVLLSLIVWRKYYAGLKK